MTAFTFHVDQIDREPIVQTRSLDDEAEAMVYARQLLSDWPECLLIDVRREGELLSRLRRVTVALANKMARIVWALMAHGGTYKAPAAAV
jgi:hypothetical protein